MIVDADVNACATWLSFPATSRHFTIRLSGTMLGRHCLRPSPFLVARAGVSAPVAAEGAPACRFAGLALWRVQVDRASNQQTLPRGIATHRAALSDLVPALQEESRYEKENYQGPTAAQPPRPWKLVDTPESSHLTLTRKFESEEIRVEVSASDQPESEEAPALEEADEDAINEAVVDDVGVVFNVHVTKGDQSLVFECRSDGSYMMIEHVSLEPTTGDVDDDYYGGPVFHELDDKVQEQFNNYLADRQVDNELGAYLLTLIEDKEQREYMAWLDRMQTFLSK